MLCRIKPSGTPCSKRTGMNALAIATMPQHRGCVREVRCLRPEMEDSARRDVGSCHGGVCLPRVAKEVHQATGTVHSIVTIGVFHLLT